jgi:2-polyprenyl-6-methoxyphenol hydroxylase-like FAD-dependent oxidoreductase
MTRLAEKTSVLIVGGGPCGLMLAIELGRRGIAAVVVDKKPSTAVNPQANATQARTMEYFRRLGFADEIRALGLPPDYPTDIAYFTRYARHELARFKLPTSREASASARDLAGSWSAAELPHRVSQKFVEQVLRRHAASQSSVSLHYGWQLTSFVEHTETVSCLLENVDTGERHTLVADYVIGVDGARSTVRRQLGINYRGETGIQRDFFGGRMVAVYLRAPDFYKVMTHERAWMYWAFNSQRRSWLAAVNGKDEFAFHTQLKPGEDDGPVSDHRAHELFDQAMGVALEIELLAVDTWVAGHALVAEQFGGGRVYIGGDAAHLFTPAGGLGYNTAIEDAVNLGWKLAAVIKGAGGPGLLPSYAFERHALAVRNTGYARSFADSIGNFIPESALESDDSVGAAARSKASAYLNAHARREFNIPGVTFGGRYDGSPVIVSDGAAPPEDSANAYFPTASPGGRAPHLWLPDGRSIYDLFGFEWTLLRLGHVAADVSPFLHAADTLCLEITVVDIPWPEVRTLYGADLILIRPDQIVAWRGNGGWPDVQGLFAKLMGQVAATRNIIESPRLAV